MTCTTGVQAAATMRRRGAIAAVPSLQCRRQGLRGTDSRA